jgi:hypothetical protein
MSVARRNIVSGERAREGDGDLWKTILLWIPKDLRIGPKEGEELRCREVSGVVSAAPSPGGGEILLIADLLRLNFVIEDHAHIAIEEGPEEGGAEEEWNRDSYLKILSITSMFPS